MKLAHDKTKIIPFEPENRKIYAYTLLDVPSHEGYIKVGQTEQDVEKRVRQQVDILGLTTDILFERKAQHKDKEWFSDHDLHNFFMKHDIKRGEFPGSANEWFYFDGFPERCEELTDKFINKDYSEAQTSDEAFEYILRDEQEAAVQDTYSYYKNPTNGMEYLWNAKPRFGKTLTTYDFIVRTNARNVLIVTNRPAIANSWYDDFHKFISWKFPGLKFVSETEALKNKAMSREDFLDFAINTDLKNVGCIAFVSLQDLKGAEFAGGDFDKLRWIPEINWDLLVVDEAHEGVDTYKTEKAFSAINRKFTLHLSGTPFKALATRKFHEDQVYNWSYLDEQKAKENWDYSKGTNPYAGLPTLNLFTYQMSKMITDEVKEKAAINEEESVDYTFDLNEFFSTKENGKFVYEEAVIKFLDNLTQGKFPFAESEYRHKLNHTLWLLNRVASAKALEKLLRKHPVFSKYKIILAAGDGISEVDEDEELEEEHLDLRTNERSYDKVKKAISEYKKTITLSVGQLTTGVTIPEWSGVLMLSNIKSPSLYFQAAFRSQNPYEFTDSETGKLMVKQNAYIFDFAPDRTLILYDELANDLMPSSNETGKERKENIRELLNFFPVIGEDKDGTMKELNVAEILTIPRKIKATEVVRRGFMSNLLFKNISAIFSAPAVIKDILNKMPIDKSGKIGKPEKINVTNPQINDEGEVEIPEETVINTTHGLFGEKIYKAENTEIIEKIFDKQSDDKDKKEAVESITKTLDSGIDKVKEKYGLKKGITENIKKETKKIVENTISETEEEFKNAVKEAEEEKERKISELPDSENREKEIERINKELEERRTAQKEKAMKAIEEKLEKAVQNIVETQQVKVEENKKKTTEDEVRDHLRGFARTIPSFLMAYGDRNTKLENFDKVVDSESFEELTGITIEEFVNLRDGMEYEEDGKKKTMPGLFDEIVFNASIQQFFDKKEELEDYMDDKNEEDIFDYIPHQKTNQIFTPKIVVEIMVDVLEAENPEIFKNKNLKFVDLYTKSGLYLTEIAKRLYKGLKDEIPDSEERMKWILENQIYGAAPTDIIYNIVKNYVYGDRWDIEGNIVKADFAEISQAGKMKENIEEIWGEDMKFDVIIGNPPYHEGLGNEGGNKSKSKSIYHLFISESLKMNPKYIIFIIPSRWMLKTAEGIPKEWTDNMLNSKNIITMHDFEDASICFPDVEIKGGVSFFLLDRDYNGNLEYIYYPKDEAKPIKRFGLLDPLDLGTVVRDPRAVGIIKKIAIIEGSYYNDRSFSSIVSPKDYYTNKKYLTSKWDNYKLNPDKDSNIKYYLNKNIHGRLYGWIKEDQIPKNKQSIFNNKVYIPAAGGTGSDSKVLGNPFFGESKSVCSQTYLVIGYDPIKHNLSKIECENIITYIKTRFFRYLVSIKKITQNGPRGVYQFVPLQDFTENSDIDWSKSIPEIEQQLYKKYGLNEEEIKFIEEKIQPME